MNVGIFLKKRMRIFIATFHFFLFTSVHASEISGYITDCSSNSPLSGVNLRIDGLGFGTVTNSKGYFRLVFPKNCKGRMLKISCIGYKSFELQAPENTGPAQSYCMEEDVVTLTSVTVISTDALISMLRIAYERIPDNYPDFPTNFQGFYREGLKLKNGPVLEFTEAILNGYKTSYSGKTDGQISIEKSRKNIYPGRDTINLVRFYGGPFFPHTYDIVHSRKEFIQPSNFKYYQYQLEEEVLYDGKVAYKIKFYPKKEKGGIAEGSFLIDKETLAYIQFDYNSTEEGIRQKMMGFLGPLSLLTAYKRISYYNYNNKWCINSIQSNTEYKNTKSNKLLEATIDYVTTSVEFDDVKPIPYEKQAKYSDVLTDIATEYSMSSWKDYSILEQGKTDGSVNKLQYSIGESEHILSKTYQHTKTKREYIFAFIRRFYFDYGLNYGTTDFPIENFALNYTFNSGNQYQSIGKGKQISSSLHGTQAIGYKLTKNWSLFYEEQSDFKTQSQYFKDNIFGLSRTICIKQGGQQFFVEPQIAYYRKFYGTFGGEFKNSDKDLEIDGHTFNAKRIAFYPGNLNQGIKAGAVFKTRISKILYFVLGGCYDYSLSQSPKLLIAEQTGWFKQKVFLPLGDHSINYQENGKQIISSSFQVSNWSVYTGLRFDF